MWRVHVGRGPREEAGSGVNQQRLPQRTFLLTHLCSTVFREERFCSLVFQTLQEVLEREGVDVNMKYPVIVHETAF